MNKRIQYDRHTHDFAAYVDDVLIGYFASYGAAERACNEYVYETLRRAAQHRKYLAEVQE